MTTDPNTSLQLTRIIKADPDRVFRAWTDPVQMKEWACPEALTVAECQVDLRVGGSYRIRMNAPDGGFFTASGVYREIDAPRRLVFTWDWEEQRMGETLVTIELSPAGESTELVLTHALLPSAEARDNHVQGWSSQLNQLDRLFETSGA